MNAPLYDTEILRLAASVPFDARLSGAMATVEKRSPTCGSRVAVDMDLDAQGRVAAIGMAVHACALGQASSALMLSHAKGRTGAEIEAARDQLRAFLAGEGEAPDWPGLQIFVRAQPHRGRHASILLPFAAAAEAAALAGAR